MLSLTPFIGSLPPASLATTDLARFVTRALGRRTPEELVGVRELLADKALAGYPDELRPAMLTVVERLLAEAVPPDELDPERVERLLASRAFLTAMDRRLKLGRQPLRPGTPVSSPLRATLGRALHVLPGHGPQLVLVAPVDLLRIGQLGWSCLRAPALARPMDGDQAEVVRETWALIEERWGWDTAEGLPLRARFVAVASRQDFDAARVVQALTGLEIEARVALWDAAIEHLRDQELGEARRPGWKGLHARLAAQGLEVPDAELRPLVAIAEAAFRACAPSVAVAEGRCPCTPADLRAFGEWADVPDATRARLTALAPEVIEHHLRILAELEAGRLDVAFDDDLRRELRILRDALLRPRYGRDADALFGADPLLRARALLAAGHDRACIVADLRTLAEEAREAAERRRPEAREPAEAEAAVAAPVEAEEGAPAPPVNPFAGMGDEPRAPTSRPITGGEGVAPKSPFAEPEAPVAALPPMPRPPPRSRPITTRRIELPPMPEPPPPNWAATGRARARTHTRPVGALPPLGDTPALGATPPRPPATPTARTSPTAPAPAVAPTPKAPPAARPRTTPTVPLPPGSILDGPNAPRPRPATAPHLVTPSQASAFYESAFRELQILERDLLERGPWQAAVARVATLEREADGLAVALGPSARSGDRDFRVALQRVQLVQSYLGRIKPLLEASPEPAPTTPDVPVDEPPEPSPSPGVFGRLGRLLKKERAKAGD